MCASRVEYVFPNRKYTHDAQPDIVHFDGTKIHVADLYEQIAKTIKQKDGIQLFMAEWKNGTYVRGEPVPWVDRNKPPGAYVDKNRTVMVVRVPRATRVISVHAGEEEATRVIPKGKSHGTCPFTPRAHPYPRPMCTFCNRPGHTEDRCFKRLARETDTSKSPSSSSSQAAVVSISAPVHDQYRKPHTAVQQEQRPRKKETLYCFFCRTHGHHTGRCAYASKAQYHEPHAQRHEDLTRLRVWALQGDPLIEPNGIGQILWRRMSDRELEHVHQYQWRIEGGSVIDHRTGTETPLSMSSSAAGHYVNADPLGSTCAEQGSKHHQGVEEKHDAVDKKLTCSICNRLFVNCVTTTCCMTSYCQGCLAYEPQCPVCGGEMNSTCWVPNIGLRQMVLQRVRNTL